MQLDTSTTPQYILQLPNLNHSRIFRPFIAPNSINIITEILRLHGVREPLRCRRRKVPHVHIIVLLQLLQVR